ncbi:MAG: PIN domain-containing protein [Nitrososphaerales archaeon]
MADTFVLATARKLRAKVITRDTDFKNIGEAILL